MCKQCEYCLVICFDSLSFVGGTFMRQTTTLSLTATLMLTLPLTASPGSRPLGRRCPSNWRLFSPSRDIQLTLGLSTTITTVCNHQLIATIKTIHHTNHQHQPTTPSITPTINTNHQHHQLHQPSTPSITPTINTNHQPSPPSAITNHQHQPSITPTISSTIHQYHQSH